MVGLNPTILIITLNVSGLMIPISNRNRLDFKKQDLTICCLQENCFNNKDTNKLKIKGKKKRYTTLKQSKESQGSYINKAYFRARTLPGVIPS